MKELADGQLVDTEDHQILSYAVLDEVYQRPRLKFIRGKFNDLASINATPGDSGLTFTQNIPTSQDPVVFSFVHEEGVRMLLAKIYTNPPPNPSTSTFSLLKVPDNPDDLWPRLSSDITLEDSEGTPVATNPHGVAHVGDKLYIIDYDSQKIVILDEDELNAATHNLPDGSTLTLATTPYDLSLGQPADLPAEAKGQVIIALQDSQGTTYIFALFIVPNEDPDTQGYYSPSILVKLSVDPDTGGLAYEDKIDTLGFNAQAIIPVTNSQGVTSLLIPSIGGQQNENVTNGTFSTLESVPAFSGSLQQNRVIHLLCDAMPAQPEPPEPPVLPSTYDFRMIAASSRAGDSEAVFILTGYFIETNQAAQGNTTNPDYPYYAFKWKLYKTTVGQLLGIIGTNLSQAEIPDPPPSPPVEGQILTIVASGTTEGNEQLPYGIYFWDILYEPGDTAAQDRVWFVKGSELNIFFASAVNLTGAVQFAVDIVPELEEDTDEPAAAQTAEWKIGGQNINSVDPTAITIRQEEIGVSLKRGMRANIPETKLASLRAALAVTTTAEAAGEETDEDE